MCLRESLFIRALGFGLLSLAISSQGSIVVAQDICGCNRVVPYPGSYRIDFPEKVGRPGVGGANVVVSDTGGVIGGIITASAPGGGSLTLECRPDGAFTGFMQPMDQPSRIPAGVIGALAGGFVGVNGNVPTGLSMVSEFNVIVVRPGQASVANEVMEPTLMFSRQAGAGAMPAAICDQVRNEISDTDDFIAAYSDTELVAEAEAVHRPALSPEFMASPDGSDDAAYFTDHHDTSYRSLLLRKHIDPTVPLGTTGTDGDGTGAAAWTDSLTCLITPPEDRDIFGKCRLGIEIRAIMAHEEEHRADCIELNKDEDGNDRPDGYTRWVNHPSNLALTELRAHGVQRLILQEWLDDNCGG